MGSLRALAGGILLVTLAGAGLTACGTGEAPLPLDRAALFAPGPRRIILISLDDLRADRLSCYGNTRPTSPFLDRLATEGIRFERATCPANWTLPSHISMLTGLYPFRHGVTRKARTLSDDVPSLVESLQIAGFRTAAITGGGFLRSHYGFDRGFDSFHAAPRLAGKWPDNLRRARQWLGEHPDEDLFLFLHTYEIHEPFQPPQEYIDRFLPHAETRVDGSIPMMRELEERGATEKEAAEALAHYDAGIRYTDDLLAEWYGALEEDGLTGNLLLIVTSDHGEQFWEHGHTGHGHDFLGRELTNVPMIVRLPGEPRAGKTIQDQVSFLDVMPTVLDAAGVPIPPDLDGASLLPLLTGTRPDPRDASTWQRRTASLDRDDRGIFLCEGDHFLTVGSDRWKVVLPQINIGNKRLREKPRLFDLQKDPAEQHALPLKGPRAMALRAAFDSLIASGRPATVPAIMQPDEETLRQLETLGYAQ